MVIDPKDPLPSRIVYSPFKEPGKSAIWPAWCGVRIVLTGW